jgi:trehalose/maltose transport system substrate-binding protein
MEDGSEIYLVKTACPGALQALGRGENLIAFLLVAAVVIPLAACRFHASDQMKESSDSPTLLTVTALVDDANADFERQTLNEFAASRRNLQVRYIPAFESTDARLGMYKQLFKARSPEPDIAEIDVIWPGLIAEDLLDLAPYFGGEIQAFPAELIRTYTVHGRLIAIPLFVDTGLLYCRSDLLRKYGFTDPPATWDELERMSQVIQRGERGLGKTNFWGYVWQGSATEALTCNGLEWQASQGGGHIIESDGTISVCNANAVRAVERAVSWVGRISPPGTTAYTEDDSFNLYAAGNAAFMRNWSSSYGAVRDLSIGSETAVALLPAGLSGHSRTLGGIAVGVSRYSEHREEAVAALRYLSSAASQTRRAIQAGIAPTLVALEQRPDLLQQTPFHGSLLSGQILTGLVARPSVVAGRVYDQVSEAYYLAVHSALTRQVPAATALARLQTELVRITKTQVLP